MQINLIIDRLFVFFEVDTNAALAQRLGISATTLSNWKSRNSFDFDLIFTKCEGINLNWLFFGEGKMRRDDQMIGSSPPINESQITYKRTSLGYIEALKAKQETIDLYKHLVAKLETDLEICKNKQDDSEPVNKNGQKRKAV